MLNHWEFNDYVSLHSLPKNNIYPSKENYIFVWDYLKNKYGNPIGNGMHRAAFANKEYIFKYPLNLTGYNGNIRESRLYAEDPKNKARCRLANIRGVPILVMEKLSESVIWVNQNEIFFENPWMRKLRDAHQVGKNRKGQYVCYDYETE